MSTHAAAGKQWSDQELDTLVVEDGFRLRGLEVTRLDTFVDAAFAFVLTLLVISFDEIPQSFTELLEAAKRIPGFAASFAVLMMFWLTHRRWSRRYGLENARNLLLSLTLIFVVMVYVYPLRMIFEGMFDQLSGGRLPSSYQIETYLDLRLMFVFYSVGFFAMSLLVALLYLGAIRAATTLNLNALEVRQTRASIQSWVIATAFAAVSILVALFIADNWIPVAGYMYFVAIPAMWLPAYLDRKTHRNKSKTP